MKVKVIWSCYGSKKLLDLISWKMKCVNYLIWQNPRWNIWNTQFDRIKDEMCVKYLIALAMLLKLIPSGDSKERRPDYHYDYDDDDDLGRYSWWWWLWWSWEIFMILKDDDDDENGVIMMRILGIMMIVKRLWWYWERMTWKLVCMIMMMAERW